MGGDGAEMHDNPGLVVTRSPAVDPPVPLCWLERSRLPLFDRARRLHVVVGVEQDRRGVLRCRDLGEDRRMSR
jgi:hypothetical protein